MSGRLTLSWVNKDQALVPTDSGGYEWVERHDPRVTEVRLLHQLGRVGDVTNTLGDNLLILGDSYDALHALVRTSEYAAQYRGKVKLIYIDPPFNTGQAFEHYDDALEHSVWLGMMRERLLLIRELLSPDGSVWVHLDDVEVAYCRVLLDQIFGRRAFVSSIIWQKRTTRDNRAAFSSSHDYLLVYSPKGGAVWKESRNRLSDDGEYSNPDNDPNGPWRSIPMSAQAGHATTSQFYAVTTPAGVIHDPPDGRAWTYTEQRFRELLLSGRVYWPRAGSGRPRLKRYQFEETGLVPDTIWLADRDQRRSETLHNGDVSRPRSVRYP